jgi:hypothetical protein
LSLRVPRRATPEVLGGLAGSFLRDRELYCVDGANVFDAYAFSTRARAEGLDAAAVLDRVFVTRTFTIHQLAAVVETMLPPLVRASAPETQGDAPVIAMLGLDHLFLEESLRASERGRVLAGVMRRLTGLRAAGARLLVTWEAPPQPARWWQPLRDFGDVRGLVRNGPDNRLAIELIQSSWKMGDSAHGAHRADIQHVPDGGDRGLAAVSPRLEGGTQGGL